MPHGLGCSGQADTGLYIGLRTYYTGLDSEPLCRARVDHKEFSSPLFMTHTWKEPSKCRNYPRFYL